MLKYFTSTSKLADNSLIFCGVSQYAEILYFKIKVSRQLINIHDVTDFHGGFVTILSGLTSNTRWITQLGNSITNTYKCVGNI